MIKQIVLTFLGTGSAFTTEPGNFHSNLLLESPSGQHLLIDCGTDIPLSLNAAQLDATDIQDIYVSHLHADHAGGLEWMALQYQQKPALKKPTLWLSEALAKPLWEKVLSGSLAHLNGKKYTLTDYFNVKIIEKNQTFLWEAVQFQLVQTLHYLDGFTFAPSFGLLFTINQKVIFLTTDLQFNQHLYQLYYDQADIIFHDCETSETPSGVHPHYDQLKSLPQSIKAKMWLYHYNAGTETNAEKDGFLGFVHPRQTFTF